MSVIFFLVKFFDNKAYAQDFVEGSVHANTLKTFKALEGIDDSGQADRHEETIDWLQPDHRRLEINGMDITDDSAGPMQRQRSWLDHLNVFCLHAAHSGNLDTAKASNENIEALRRQLTIPDECLALGRHAVVVENAPEFIRRMEITAEASGYRMARGLVRYYDAESSHGNFRDVESIFNKQDSHSYQREFRSVFDRGLVSAAPLVLKIGDTSDITQRFDSTELNGENFSGGEIAVL